MKPFLHFAASTFLFGIGTAFGQGDRPPLGTCDQYIGPEKEQCLKEGGTIEAGMTANSADDRFWHAPVRDRATIRAVQQALQAQGYDAGPADGALNAKTVQAVKQVQNDRELEATGVLDRRTVAALGIDVAR